jgi:hypothetical protein
MYERRCQHWEAYAMGYESPTGRNPYLWSSETADAFELGRFMRLHNWESAVALRKSRGYQWRVHMAREEIRVRVDGGEVTGIGYAPEQHQAEPDGGGYVATQLVDIATVDQLTYTARLTALVAPGVWRAAIAMPDNCRDGEELVAHVSQITPRARAPKPKPQPREEASAHGPQMTIAGTWHQPTDTQRQGRLF